MKDGVIKGNGNSRYLKTVENALSLYSNYEAFMQAFIAGTLPVDFNGINAAGWSTQGTPLNKATLLDDNTEVTIWGNSANRTVNEALAVVGKHGYVTGQFTGDGEMTYRLTLGFQPKFCAVIRDESLGERPLFVLAGTVSGPADSGLADSMKVLYTINSTGITFTKHSSSSTGVFSSGKTYSYIAFR